MYIYTYIYTYVCMHACVCVETAQDAMEGEG